MVAGSSIVAFSFTVKNKATLDDMKEIRIGPFAHEDIQFDLTNTIASSKMNITPEDPYIKFNNTLEPSELVEIHIPAVIRDSVRLGEVSVLRGGYHPFKHCARTCPSMCVTSISPFYVF